MKRALSFKEDILPILFKLVVVVGAIIGTYSTAYGDSFMSGGEEGGIATVFLFFTIQSNIWIMMACIIGLIFNVCNLFRAEKVEMPNWFLTIKFVFTVAITLTFLVFSVMLTPTMVISGYTAYLATASNIFCHNLVPIFAIIDWLVCDYKHKSKKGTFLLGTVMPLYYLAFALICSFSGVSFGKMNGKVSKVPYFFLDYEANGWFNLGNGQFGVFYWIIVIVIMVLGISGVLMWGKNKIAKKETNKLERN